MTEHITAVFKKVYGTEGTCESKRLNSYRLALCMIISFPRALLLFVHYFVLEILEKQNIKRALRCYVRTVYMLLGCLPHSRISDNNNI